MQGTEDNTETSNKILISSPTHWQEDQEHEKRLHIRHVGSLVPCSLINSIDADIGVWLACCLKH